YEHTTRRPSASINFVTAHDGFTLRDLVSYNDKHNEANGEDNGDGESHNNSWNHGVEGETDDPAINALRAQQQRNFLSMLLLSQGVPMVLGGDEFGRSQGGNNNGYCQDNEISWFNWKKVDASLLEFTSKLIDLRKAHPVFHRPRWFHERSIHGTKVEEILWFTPDGNRMQEENWGEDNETVLTIFLNGNSQFYVNPFADPVSDDSFFLIMNAHHEDVAVTLPAIRGPEHWCTVFDTVRGWSD